MKRRLLKSASLALASVALAACSAYDDSGVDARMDAIDEELSRLEEMAQQINTDALSAFSIFGILSEGDYITSCEALPDGSGYTISFTESDPVTVYYGKNGTDGQNGKDGTDGVDGENGVSPVIGIAQDGTGAYCWTLNGEFLEDSDGNHIYLTLSATQGKDGIVPQLRIVDGMWQLSLDEGLSWSDLGRASDAAQSAPYIFSKVEDTGDAVIFTLASGDSFSLLKLGSPDLTLIGWEGVKVVPLRSVSISCTVARATSKTEVRAVANNGYSAEVIMESVSSGRVVVTAPAVVAEGDVLVVADNGYGFLSIRKMHLSSAGITVTELENIGGFVDFEW